MKSKFALLLLIISLICIVVLSSCDDESDSNTKKVTIEICYEGRTDTEEVYRDLALPPEKTYLVLTVDPGYCFDGIYDSKGVLCFENYGKQIEYFDMSGKDIRLYVYAKICTYNLDFYADGGTFENGESMVSISAKHKDNLQNKLPIPVINDPSLEFDGWFDSQGNRKFEINSVLDVSQFSIGNSSNITLYAKYKPKKCSLTIDIGDGVTAPTQLTTDYGIDFPDMTQYYVDDGEREIVGWSVSATENVSPPTTVTEDITVYAVWKRYKDVNFMYPGPEIKTERVYEGADGKFYLPESLEVPGFRLVSWHEDMDHVGDPVSFVEKDRLMDMYYGWWKPIKYTLSFDCDGIESINDLNYYYGDTSSLPVPKKMGYKFLGWTCEGYIGAFDFIPAELYGDHTLSPSFAPMTFEIKLNLCGGSGISDTMTVSYEHFYTAPVPVKYGYSFLGWYTSPDDEAERYTTVSGESFEAWDSLNGGEFFAHWQINVYKVTYKDGDNVYSTQRYTHGDVISLEQAIANDEKYFGGWVDESDGHIYTERTVVLSNMTLTALWLDSIPISTAEELKYIALNPSASYHLLNDINLAGEAWTPIPSFSGTLDGAGHSILNFSLGVNTSGSTYLGFIAVNYGTIKDLTISQCVISCIFSASNSVSVTVSGGAICGANLGSIIGCAVTDTTLQATGKMYPYEDRSITYAFAYFGSIAGSISGNGFVDSCDSDITMQVSLTQNQKGSDGGRAPGGYGTLFVGGIVGYSIDTSTVIRCCTYSGRIQSLATFTGSCWGGVMSANSQAGGIVAVNCGTVDDCYSDADIEVGTKDSAGHETYFGGGTYKQYVSTYAYAFVGGIVAQNYGTVKECTTVSQCSAGSDNGTNSGGAYVKAAKVGGIVGVNMENATVKDSHSAAEVIVINGNDRAAGALVGYNAGRIKNSYSEGNVISYTRAAGFVGENAATGTVMDCISFTSIEFLSLDGTVGTLVAVNSGMISGCVCDSSVTLTYNGVAVNPVSQDGVSSLDTDQILTENFIRFELAWEGSSWIVSDGELPRLYFEAFLPVNE